MLMQILDPAALTVPGNEVQADYELLCLFIARNLGHETPRVVTRGNLKTDRDAYRDLYGHSRKMAYISLRLKEKLIKMCN